jgi:hypothetical protein
MYYLSSSTIACYKHLLVYAKFSRFKTIQ